MIVTTKRTGFYKVLDVPVDASCENVKLAFFRLHRVHTPQKDPEGYVRIKYAFETLCCERARRCYDTLREYEGETGELLKKAISSMTAGNYLGASRHLRQVLVNETKAHGARDLQGICQNELGLLDEALQNYGMLVTKCSVVPLYWLHYGDTYLRKAEKCTGPDRKPLIGSARSQYRKAFKLDPSNIRTHTSIARTYVAENKFDQALSWVLKSVGSSRNVGFHDLEALFYMCRIHAMAHNEKKVLSVARRIEDVVPSDRDLRLYVAYLFGTTGIELLEMKFFEQARHFLKIATRLDPEDPDLTRMRKKVEVIVEADSIWKLLENDVSIINPVKTLAALIYVNFSGYKVDTDFDKTVKSIRSEIEDSSPVHVIRSIKILKDNYPRFYHFESLLWDQVFAVALEASGQKFDYADSASKGYSKSAPAYSDKSAGAVPGSGVKDPILPEIVPGEDKDNSVLIGAASALILGIILFFVMPPSVKVIGALGGAVIGYWIGSLISKFLKES